MKKLSSLIALTLVAGAAQAGVITENLDFNLSGFVDITGNTPPPLTFISGSITVTYDPTLSYDNDTTDLVVNSLSGITVDSTLGFTYQDGLLEFGGIANDADFVSSYTNDLIVSFNVSNPASPTFVPCSTPGYTCGIYTGSSLVDAAGYTRAGSSTGWFYGAPQSIVSPVPIVPAVPEPGTYVLMMAGLAAVGVTRRYRKQ